jgi:hypothetical protein
VEWLPSGDAGASPVEVRQAFLRAGEARSLLHRGWAMRNRPSPKQASKPAAPARPRHQPPAAAVVVVIRSNTAEERFVFEVERVRGWGNSTGRAAIVHTFCCFLPRLPPLPFASFCWVPYYYVDDCQPQPRPRYVSVFRHSVLLSLMLCCKGGIPAGIDSPSRSFFAFQLGLQLPCI